MVRSAMIYSTFFFSRFIYNIWWCPRGHVPLWVGLVESKSTDSHGIRGEFSSSWSLESIGYLSYPLLYKQGLLSSSFKPGQAFSLSRFGLGRCDPVTSWQSRLMGKPPLFTMVWGRLLPRGQLEGAEVRRRAFWLLSYSSTEQHPTAPVLLVCTKVP